MSDERTWVDRLVDDMIAAIDLATQRWPAEGQEFALRDGRTFTAHSLWGFNRIATPHGPYCDFTDEAWALALGSPDVLHMLIKMQLEAVMEME